MTVLNLRVGVQEVREPLTVALKTEMCQLLTNLMCCSLSSVSQGSRDNQHVTSEQSEQSFTYSHRYILSIHFRLQFALLLISVGCHHIGASWGDWFDEQRNRKPTSFLRKGKRHYCLTIDTRRWKLERPWRIVAIRNWMPYRTEEFRNMLRMSSSEFFDVFEIQADAVPESELAAPAGLTPSDAPVIFMKWRSLFMWIKSWIEKIFALLLKLVYVRYRRSKPRTVL